MTGERIKKLRKEKGLTQQQLGEMLGVQKSAIAKYENGRVPNLKKETLSRLAEIFNVTPNYLLGIDEPAYHGHSHNIPYIVMFVVEMVFLLKTILKNIFLYLNLY